MISHVFTCLFLNDWMSVEPGLYNSTQIEMHVVLCFGSWSWMTYFATWSHWKSPVKGVWSLESLDIECVLLKSFTIWFEKTSDVLVFAKKQTFSIPSIMSRLKFDWIWSVCNWSFVLYDRNIHFMRWCFFPRICGSDVSVADVVFPMMGGGELMTVTQSTNKRVLDRKRFVFGFGL